MFAVPKWLGQRLDRRTRKGKTPMRFAPLYPSKPQHSVAHGLSSLDLRHSQLTRNRTGKSGTRGAKISDSLAFDSEQALALSTKPD